MRMSESAGLLRARRQMRLAVSISALVTTIFGVTGISTATAQAGVTARDAQGIVSSQAVIDGVACPDVMVIAARGTGEKPTGSAWNDPSRYQKKDIDYGVGSTLLTLYNQLTSSRPDLKISLEPVIYPVPDLSHLKTLFDFGTDATTGAQAIVAGIKQTDKACGHTVSYVLAGFSLGAWVVHKALHDLAGTGLLGEVAGSALFGDPKFVPFQKIVHAYKLLDINLGIAALVVDQKDNGVPASVESHTGSWCFPLDPVCQVLPDTRAWLAELAPCLVNNRTLCAHLQYADKQTGKATKFLDPFLPAASLWPHLTLTTPPDGTVNTPYSWTATAAPGTKYTWTWVGSLPPGLPFSTGGLLSGTPAQAGTYSFKVTATGLYQRKVTGQVSVTVNPETAGFTSGDLLVGVGNGQVAQYDSAGNLVSTLDTGTGSSEETGGCFAPTGEYYQTNFADQSISKFAADGSLENSRWATVSGSPESCLAGADGTVYVGVVDPGTLVQFSSDGTVVNTFSPNVESRGVDWLSWGSDSCTVRYTSEGTIVFQFDVCNGTQLADFTDGLPGDCFENAPLSDGLLVACDLSIIRLDNNGNVTQTYTSPSSAGLFALTAQPGASAFWVADYNGSASTVYEIDLSGGTTITSFTPASENDVAGLMAVP